MFKFYENHQGIGTVIHVQHSIHHLLQLQMLLLGLFVAACDYHTYMPYPMITSRLLF
jgi:hypothetical protein